MNASVLLARRPDGTVATEHYAKLSRTQRSQAVAGGMRSLIRAAINSLTGRTAQGHLSGDPTTITR